MNWLGLGLELDLDGRKTLASTPERSVPQRNGLRKRRLTRCSSFVIISAVPSGGQRGNEIATVPFDLPGKLQGEQSRPHLTG
jgi:hypothetical protein